MISGCHEALDISCATIPLQMDSVSMIGLQHFFGYYGLLFYTFICTVTETLMCNHM